MTARCRGPRWLLALGIWGLLGMAPTAGAWAGDVDQARASAAYDAGVEAARSKQYRRAAELFAEADEIVPNLVALRSAINAAVLCGDAVLAMRLVERVERRDADRALRRAAREAEAKLGDRIGRIVVECPEASCTATVDGEPAPIGEPLIVATGSRRVIIEHGELVDRQSVDVGTAEVVTVTPDAAPPSAHEAGEGEETASEGGISPVWFWLGLGATAVLGGITIGSAVDTASLHDEYMQTGEGADDGEAAQTRTNVLFFSTVGMAVTTAVVGIFAVRWSEEASLEVGLVPAGVRIVGRLP